MVGIQTYVLVVKKCPACGTRDANDLLVVCPKCGSSYDDQPSFSAIDVSAVESRILKRLTWRVGKFVFGGFSLLTLVTIWKFGALWNAGILRLEKNLNDRIGREFKTERIQKTITKVAETQAGALLKDSVQPKIDAFDAFLKSLKKQDQASFDAVNSELATLKERNRLMQLADRAVTDGDRKALEKLIKLQNDETNPLAALAGSLTLQVKNFYLFGNRLGDYKLLLHRFDLSDNQLPGLPPSPESYSTGDLVAGLRDSEDWRARAKCADLLGSRKVKSVPEALLAAVQTDNHLEVVRNALRSFSIVTGYSSPDVFAYEPAEDWWREHMDEINRTLPDR